MTNDRCALTHAVRTRRHGAGPHADKRTARGGSRNWRHDLEGLEEDLDLTDLHPAHPKETP